MSVFGSRSWAVGTVTCSKKLILSSAGKGAKGHGDSPLCFVCCNENGSMLTLGRVRVFCLILVVGMG